MTNLNKEYKLYKDALPLQLTKEQFKKLWRDYKMQRNATVNRCDRNGTIIEFKLSFIEWLCIWHKSGQLFNRGRKFNQYVMSRHDDIGHYEIGNVHIQLQSENHKEYRERYFREVLKSVITPIGTFQCMSQAARALGISKPTMKKWIIDATKPEYSFL